MIACSMVRDQPHYRADAVRCGLRRLGYTLVAESGRADVLVIWNRYGWRDTAAKEVESRGGSVIVMENGYLGNDFAGDRWYAAALSHHNGAGQWFCHGNERWDLLGHPLLPWSSGEEAVVLPQRGIGPAGVAMPSTWTQSTLRMLESKKIKHRLRPHPGQHATKLKSLEQDLSNAKCAVTWGSGAAIKALAIGVPVYHDFPSWIGAPASLPLSKIGVECLKSDEARIEMFRRLAWAMWRVSEIESGFAFDTLLKGKSK